MRCKSRDVRRAVSFAVIAFFGNAACAQCTPGWIPMGQTGFSSFVMDAMEWDRDGPGPQEPVLCLAGLFAASPAIHGIATWNGSTYSGIGTGISGGPGTCYTAAAMPNGDLVPAGSFPNANGTPNTNGIARWSGSWSALGVGMVSGSEVFCSAVLPDGRLVVGGNFNNIGGSMSQSLAVWNGSVWSPLGGLNNGPPPVERVDVYDLLVLPNGDLVIAGYFLYSGTTFVNHTLRYNGSAFVPMAPLLDDPGDWEVKGVNDLCLMPQGSGYEFAAAVSYQVQPNPFVTASVMAYNGSSWSGIGTPFGAQFNSAVNAVAALPNGDVIAGGSFTTPATKIARWSGGAWHPMGAGVDSSVQALHVRPNGELVVGGSFTHADGQLSRYWARWGGCPVCDGTDFNGDGLFPDTADIDDFLSVFSGGACSTGSCGDVDYNNDGLYPDTADIDALLSVFSGGTCL